MSALPGRPRTVSVARSSADPPRPSDFDDATEWCRELEDFVQCSSRASSIEGAEPAALPMQSPRGSLSHEPEGREVVPGGQGAPDDTPLLLGVLIDMPACQTEGRQDTGEDSEGGANPRDIIRRAGGHLGSRRIAGKPSGLQQGDLAPCLEEGGRNVGNGRHPLSCRRPVDIVGAAMQVAPDSGGLAAVVWVGARAVFLLESDPLALSPTD